jgi:hypothetical protein
VNIVMADGDMVLIRPATPAEMKTPAEFTVDDPVASVDQDKFREEAAAGRMRPEWTWFADDGSRIVARAVWWGALGQRAPDRPRLPARSSRCGGPRRTPSSWYAGTLSSARHPSSS